MNSPGPMFQTDQRPAYEIIHPKRREFHDVQLWPKNSGTELEEMDYFKYGRRLMFISPFAANPKSEVKERPIKEG